jgi:hypothetical protein
MKTITLTRQRLVQSQLNPAHYTTDGAMLRALRNSADEDNDYSLDRGWSVTRIDSLHRGNIRQLPHGTLHRPRHRNQNRNDRR